MNLAGPLLFWFHLVVSHSATTYLFREGEHDYRETNGERNLFFCWDKLTVIVSFDTKVKRNDAERIQGEWRLKCESEHSMRQETREADRLFGQIQLVSSLTWILLLFTPSCEIYYSSRKWLDGRLSSLSHLQVLESPLTVTKVYFMTGDWRFDRGTSNIQAWIETPQVCHYCRRWVNGARAQHSQ